MCIYNTIFYYIYLKALKYLLIKDLINLITLLFTIN